MDKSKASDDRIVESSGNVFADLNLPHSEEDMIKAAIAAHITMAIQKRKLTQVDAAQILGVAQSKVSDVIRGRLKGYSAFRLLTYLMRLGHDVEIRAPAVRQKDARGHLRFVA